MTELEGAALLRERVTEAQAVFRAIAEDPALAEAFPRAVRVTVDAISSGGKLLLCGNGGSSADAQHLAAEMVGRFTREREPWPALCLTDNVAALTAISNDYAYETALERALRAFGRAGDVLIGISTSGRSPNVLAALHAARELGLSTIALTGPGDSPIALSADIALCVEGPSPARIQEGQKFIGHTLIENVELILTQDRT
jgi:D-sedoheptulose 7-phosphate isomerase